MSLSRKQLEDVCLLHNFDKSKTCRYLIEDEFDENKWYCQKLKSNSKLKIDHDVFVAQHRKEIVASGDNCSGYLFLRNLEQGYDLD